MPIRKLVELDEHGYSLEIDPVRLKRVATAFKAWLMALDPDNDPFGFLKKDLPLVESALDGTMQLPFSYYDRPHNWEIREGLLPERYYDFSAPFYVLVSGTLCPLDDDAPYEPPEVIMKDGRRYAWAEFEDPEDSGASEFEAPEDSGASETSASELKALTQQRGTDMPRYKLVELDEHDASLEIDPVRLKRLATAFKAWLMTLDPDNDPFCFLEKDLPLVESALNGTMLLPFHDSPHNWEIGEGLLPKIYHDFAAPFYVTAAGGFHGPVVLIMEDGRRFAWGEFEDPEDSGASETPTSETPTSETPTSETPTSETPTSETPTSETSWLNSWIQKILVFLKMSQLKLEALTQRRGTKMPIYKLVEWDEEKGVSLEIDPVRLKRLATAFKAWLMTLDPDNDPFCFLEKDLPLVESALDGTMQLPFHGYPHYMEFIMKGPLPERYNDFATPFYHTAAGTLYKSPELIRKNGKYYAWVEFEDPEDSGASETPASETLTSETSASKTTASEVFFPETSVSETPGLNSWIQMILWFLKMSQSKLEALTQRRGTKKGIRKLVELDAENGRWLEIDPVKLKRTATAFKAWLMTLDPDNDPFCFLKQDLPLVESALDGTMQLPFYGQPHDLELTRKGLLPEEYSVFSIPFYSTAAGIPYGLPKVIMKNGKYYAWVEFEAPEDSGVSETPGLNSMIQKIPGFLKRLG